MAQRDAAWDGGFAPGDEDREAESRSAAWAERHRPRRFAEVVGLRSARADLQEELRRRRPRGVLLHGPSGSGKTTLAEIYATAIRCGAGDEPCLGPDCPACSLGPVLETSDFHRWIAGASEDAARAVKIGADLRWASDAPGQSVVLVDGADRLDPAVTDAFHASVERLVSLTVIACARDLDRVPPRFASLFRPIPIPFAPVPDRLELLERVCAREGLAPEPGALDLIARCAEVGLRAMVRDLEMLARAPITVQRVLTHYGLDEEHPASRYLTLLSTGAGLSEQLAVLDAWPVSPSQKSAAIERALGDRFSGWIGGSDAPALWLQRACTSAELSRNFEARAVAHGVSPRAFWEMMIEIWERAARLGTRGSLLVGLSRSDELLNGGMPARSPGGISAPRTGPDRADLERGPEDRPPTRAAPRGSRARRHGRDREDDGYISGEDTRRLLDAASFLVQAHGACLNTRFTIRHARVGPCTDDIISARVRDLQHELRQRYRRSARKGDAEVVQFLYVHGQSREEGPFTRVVASLPGRWGDAERWLRRSFLTRKGTGSVSDDALEFRCPAAPVRDDAAAMAFHLDQLRWLCAGVHPDALADEADADAGRLCDALDLASRSDHPLGARPTVQRCGVSRAIDNGSREAFVDDGVPILYATRPGGAVFLTQRWEMAEFRYRQGWRASRPDRASFQGGVLATAAGEPCHAALEQEFQTLEAAWRADGPGRRQRRPMDTLDVRLEAHRPSEQQPV